VRAHVAEFIGTFVLVFAGCGAIAVGSLDALGIAVAFGLAVAAMIYALGHISGAHINPAVSVAFALERHVPWVRVLTYGLAQIGGAVAAALLLRLLFPLGALGVTRPSGSVAQAFVMETILTFILVLVVMAVSTDVRAIGQAAAIAIGGAVTLGALVGGHVSGASMNPARSLGPALVSGDLEGLWLYIAAPLTGALLGALTYRFVRAGPTPFGTA
jgi:MIP family channel proteins